MQGEKLDRCLELLENLVEILRQPRPGYLDIRGAAEYTGLSTKHIRRAALQRWEIPYSNVALGDGRPTYPVLQRMAGHARGSRITMRYMQVDRDDVRREAREGRERLNGNGSGGPA